jgi:hypothetical protein
MQHQDGEVIQSLTHPTGSRMVQVIRRPDGSARFVEYAITHTPDTGDYWTPVRQSGLYPNTSEAMAAAYAVLGWAGGDD